MDHEPIMTRQLLVMIVILAVRARARPARRSMGRRRCATASRATCSTGPTSSGSSADITSNCSTTGRRLDDLADVPGLRIRRRSGSTWSIPVDESPLVVRVDDLREVVLKPNDATERFGLAVAHQRAGHARPALFARQAARDVPRRAGGRLDRRRLGSERRGAVRIDPRRSLGRPRREPPAA